MARRTLPITVAFAAGTLALSAGIYGRARFNAPTSTVALQARLIPALAGQRPSQGASQPPQIVPFPMENCVCAIRPDGPNRAVYAVHPRTGVHKYSSDGILEWSFNPVTGGERAGLRRQEFANVSDRFTERFEATRTRGPAVNLFARDNLFDNSGRVVRHGCNLQFVDGCIEVTDIRGIRYAIKEVPR